MIGTAASIGGRETKLEFSSAMETWLAWNALTHSALVSAIGRRRHAHRRNELILSQVRILSSPTIRV
jgi:hypothetical protein